MFIGSLLGSTSPVTTYSPLLGAELTLAAGTTLRVPVDPTFELGVLVDHGCGHRRRRARGRARARLPAPWSDPLELTAGEATRLLLLGGPPFGEKIVMWWNYIGRDHDEVVAYRAEWEALLDSGSSDRSRWPRTTPWSRCTHPPLPNARMVTRGP